MSNETYLQRDSLNDDVEQSGRRLEQIITAACRAQPLLPAPAGLQTRVMAAIERRAGQWWRAPLRAWPNWAQAVLLMLCLCSVWWMVAGNAPLAGNDIPVQRWLFLPWILADLFTSLLMVLRELLWLVLRLSPVLWLLAVASIGVAVAIGVIGLNRLAKPGMS